MKLIIRILLIIALIMLISIGYPYLASSPESLEILNKILDFTVLGCDFLFTISVVMIILILPFAIIFGFKNFLKLGETATNPTERAKVLTSIMIPFSLLIRIFIFSIVVKGIALLLPLIQ